MKKAKTIILGAGVTGLAAGIATGFPVYEAEDGPGGFVLLIIAGRVPQNGCHTHQSWQE